MKESQSSIAWVEKLIAFDTTSRNSNLELISCLEASFSAYGLKPRLSRDESGKKANLFATLAADDGAVEGGLVLSGHTDVVPVDGQQWETDPFKATILENRLYGRGSSDMKSFVAVCMALLPEFTQLKLSKPLHFAFTYDEEVGCHGAKVLLEDLAKAGIKPDGCIVGEPTELRPVLAHKGIQVFRCRSQGKAAHSSLTPEGCNAIEYAAELICHIRQLANQLKKNGPFDPHFDVPFSTLSTNKIQGGNAFNTIPAFCEFFFEIRHLPNEQPSPVISEIRSYLDKDLIPRMREEYPEASIELDALGAVPSFEAREEAHLTQLLRRLRQEKDSPKVAYATEAGLYQQADIPTIICGPGSIEQAHRANEYIELDQIRKCEEFLRDLVKTLI